MSKPKKGPPPKKFLDSVLSDLDGSKDDKSKADRTAGEVRNVFLDGFGGSEKKGEDEEVIEISSVDPPDGLVEESATVPLKAARKKESPETVPTAFHHEVSPQTNLTDRTQPVARPLAGKAADEPAKMSFGVRPPTRAPASPAGQASDAQLIQAENMKLAQARIIELEKELDRLRNENQLLSSAGSIAKKKIEELTEKLHDLERARVDAIERAEMELKIAKDGLSDRQRELNKAKKKIDELEGRLSTDVRKIRVRERELENRLELARQEKTALVRAKDETILDLKRNIDLLTLDLENHKRRVNELQSQIEEQQEQIGRTVRALRLALSNLEASDPNTGVIPIKKAE